ncbi:hypothetical protein CDAR_118351, partial [Caerostris darwini]
MGTLHQMQAKSEDCPRTTEFGFKFDETNVSMLMSGFMLVLVYAVGHKDLVEKWVPDLFHTALL